MLELALQRGPQPPRSSAQWPWLAQSSLELHQRRGLGPSRRQRLAPVEPALPVEMHKWPQLASGYQERSAPPPAAWRRSRPTPGLEQVHTAQRRLAAEPQRPPSAGSRPVPRARPTVEAMRRCWHSLGSRADSWRPSPSSLASSFQVGL